MTTYPHPARLHRPHVDPWHVAAVVFAAALVGLGAWLAVDRWTGGGGGGATKDATTLVDRLFADITAGNVAAATALFRSDAVIWQGGEVQATGAKQIRAQIAAAKPAGYTITRVAPVTVVPGGMPGESFAATYYETPAFANPVLSVAQIRDGTIARLWEFGLFNTAPFDKALP